MANEYVYLQRVIDPANMKEKGQITERKLRWNYVLEQCDKREQRSSSVSSAKLESLWDMCLRSSVLRTSNSNFKSSTKRSHLVPSRWLPEGVSREALWMWTSKHCFHIRVHIHSKCMIEKPKNQLSEKLDGGAGRVMRPSHCKIIRLCFSFCSGLRNQGCQEKNLFDPKKEKAGEFYQISPGEQVDHVTLLLVLTRQKQLTS